MEDVYTDQDVADQPHSAVTSSPIADRTDQDDDNQSTPRMRHNSMPSRQASPVANVSHNRQIPAFRPRRNSSIQEPSPLARLFVRASGDQTEVIERLRERRQSLAGLALPASQSQPALQNLISPRTRFLAHARANSQPIKEDECSAEGTIRPRPTIAPIVPVAPRTPIAPVEEGKKLKFASPQVTPIPSRPQSPAQSRGRSSGRPFPMREPSTSGRSESMSRSGTIGKASEIEARESDLGGKKDEEVVATWAERLEGIEERQKRIEEMLIRLVGDR